MRHEKDIYSEECTELLDTLENLEEEGEGDFSNIASLPAEKKDQGIADKNVNLKLQPLELKEYIETPKTQQKLTTPGQDLLEWCKEMTKSYPGLR
ncbi:hypothetical protein NQ318_015907 [Aromia moschata]|uniref:Uncharacterized protein n=1 Tax=Aromia moschata TaxID=1265417 RepID=A0AAV8Y880_9CUCU|nr:hypothetical protein NQ318_015907 [Aromia moschata]